MSFAWPPVAISSTGRKVTPTAAKELKYSESPFTISGVEVIPRVGTVNRPHWAAKDSHQSLLYSLTRPHYEMSEWHYAMQLAAAERGLEVEYRIALNDGSTVIADAYNPATNTVIEYVWSHYNDKKITKYFANGYNQIWFFAEDTTDTIYYYEHANKFAWTTAVGARTDPIEFLIPTIRVELGDDYGQYD